MQSLILTVIVNNYSLILENGGNMAEEKMIPQKPVLEVLCSIQGALGGDNQKVFAKASMAQGRNWGESIPTAQTPEDLMETVSTYFQDNLKIAKSVKFEKKTRNSSFNLEDATFAMVNSSKNDTELRPLVRFRCFQSVPSQQT